MVLVGDPHLVMLAGGRRNLLLVGGRHILVLVGSFHLLAPIGSLLLLVLPGGLHLLVLIGSLRLLVLVEGLYLVVPVDPRGRAQVYYFRKFSLDFRLPYDVKEFLLTEATQPTPTSRRISAIFMSKVFKCHFDNVR